MPVLVTSNFDDDSNKNEHRNHTWSVVSCFILVFGELSAKTYLSEVADILIYFYDYSN